MTHDSDTIFVTEDGDAGPQQALISSLSIANLFLSCVKPVENG